MFKERVFKKNSCHPLKEIWKKIVPRRALRAQTLLLKLES